MQLTDHQVKDLKGLSAAEVLDRRARFGVNELPSGKRRGIFAIVLEVFKEPMFLLLVACGVLYLFLGDIQEAIMLLGFVFVIIGITVYQENKTENAIEALRDLSSPRAAVIRDGEQVRISGKEVVTDDVLLLFEGDRVPADCELVWSMNLSVDESLLTGESVPVRKTPAEGEAGEARPGGDDSPFAFSGTMVVQGQGVAIVRQVGVATAMGKIGKSLQEVREESTRLQKQVKKLVKTIAIVGAALCVAVVVIYGLIHSNWLEGLLSGITLAMAILPEEFPVVLTIFLALGAWRISKHHVLTRRVSAVETLGSATVLCSDKTGTITQNRMTIRKISVQGQTLEFNESLGAALPEEYHALVEFGVLASKKDPFDPMEKALKELGQKTLYETEHLHDDWNLIREYPLSRNLLALSHVWKTETAGAYIVAAKGAPEAVIDLCHLSRAEADSVMADVLKLADEGLRVLGVAKGRFTESALPEQQHDFPFEFIGLVGLADPIRPTVPDAVRECDGAGIRVVMITGDYPGTARNIGRQIGLRNPENAITGPELDSMSDADLEKRIGDTNIFCRVVPEQKLRIVRALKSAGEVVAMTGDGVNDAPALKAANIGVAMGKRGTDVARESAALVLLDDDFSSIVTAVRMGRRIYDNLKKAMAYIFSIHVPIAGMSLLPILLGLPVVLFPVHIVFLELIIDPACSVVFEMEDAEKDIMRRRPRDPKEPLFGGKPLLYSLLQGFGILAMNLLVFWLALRNGRTEHQATAIAFSSLILANLGLILSNRSWTMGFFATLKRPNKAFWWVVLGAAAFLGILLTVPFLQNLFHFAPMHWVDIAIVLGAGAVSILWFEGMKWIFFRRKALR